jgi:hypothetical protein
MELIALSEAGSLCLLIGILLDHFTDAFVSRRQQRAVLLPRHAPSSVLDAASRHIKKAA